MCLFVSIWHAILLVIFSFSFFFIYLYTIFLIFLLSRHWRSGIQKIRQRTALRVPFLGRGSLDRPNFYANRSCARCHRLLGRIINSGAFCRLCQLRVCKACREFALCPPDWVCVVCFDQMWVFHIEKRTEWSIRIEELGTMHEQKYG